MRNNHNRNANSGAHNWCSFLMSKLNNWKETEKITCSCKLVSVARFCFTSLLSPLYVTRPPRHVSCAETRAAHSK